MRIELAPMEGLTGYINRNALHNNFGGIDVFYTPFIPAAKKMSKKIKADLDPANNKGIELIPQIMSNQVEEVLYLGEQLKEYGYNKLNVNIGCPSGTVVSKKRGSGFLTVPDQLDAFLDELYNKTERDLTVTIKTRVGFDSIEEWPRLLEIYNRYPIPELIIHPRVRKDFYKLPTKPDAFEAAYELIDFNRTKLSYNGDIYDYNSFRKIKDRFPEIDTFMIGRGFFSFPGIGATIHNEGTLPWTEEEYKRRLRGFHDEVYAQYVEIMSGERDVLFRMKEIWAFLHQSFADGDKAWKKIKKSQRLSDYNLAVNQIFSTMSLNI